MKAVLRRLHAGLIALENGMLVVLLLTMMGVAVYQVVARNLFGTGLIWGDEMVRIAVLWVTMIGGAVAARTDSHIRIDIASKFARGALRKVIDRLAALLTAMVCLAFAWYSITFIVWDYADQVPGFGSVPAWMCEVVIPVMAFIIALRYLIRAVLGSRT